MTAAMQDSPIVDGATRLFGIIGDPIVQVKSPQEITARFHHAGYNALCLPFHVIPDNFDAALRGLKSLHNFDGFVVTVPHKVRAIPYVDKISLRASRTGAVNVARRELDNSWTGDMFDGLGLVGAIRQAGFDAKGKRAIVMGAGGAGTAIVDAIAEAGAASIVVFDLDQRKATDITARLGAAHSGCRITVGAPHVQDADLLVNATPVGMGPAGGMPAEFGQFDPTLFVADAVTMPEITPLLAHARKCGCCISTGKHMYNAQVDMIVQFLVPENRSNAFPRWPAGLNAVQKR
jgi:shikimate dehydrogenase